MNTGKGATRLHHLHPLPLYKNARGGRRSGDVCLGAKQVLGDASTGCPHHANPVGAWRRTRSHSLRSLAEKTGVNMPQWKSCMSTHATMRASFRPTTDRQQERSVPTRRPPFLCWQSQSARRRLSARFSRQGDRSGAGQDAHALTVHAALRPLYAATAQLARLSAALRPKQLLQACAPPRRRAGESKRALRSLECARTATVRAPSSGCIAPSVGEGL